MNGGRGIPATFEAEAAWPGLLAGGPRGWQWGRSNSLEGRKPVVQRHRNACSRTCNRSSQKDGRKLDSKEVKQLFNSAMQHL